MKEIKGVRNKEVSLDFSFLEISKLAMHMFCYICIKSYDFDNVLLYYIDTDSFMICVKTKDVYQDIKKMLKEDLIL